MMKTNRVNKANKSNLPSTVDNVYKINPIKSKLPLNMGIRWNCRCCGDRCCSIDDIFIVSSLFVCNCECLFQFEYLCSFSKKIILNSCPPYLSSQKYVQ